MEAIIAENVTKKFKSSILGKKIIALKNVSFQLDEHEHLAVMGPSPSGKTTLLKTIAGIYLPDEGDIRVYGKSVRRKTEEVRKITYYITPQIQLNKKLTVKENLKYFTKVAGRELTEEIIQLLETAEINDEVMDKRLETLSETQTITLKLAIGLIKKPRILLMDNIFSSLEPKIKETFTETIEKLREEITLIMVDQDMETLSKLCRKTLILNHRGEMIMMGSVEQLLKNYPYKYDVEVTLKNSSIKEKIRRLGYPTQTIGDLMRIYIKSENEILELTSKLLKMKEHILKFEISGIDMEDIYYWIINK